MRASLGAGSALASTDMEALRSILHHPEALECLQRKKLTSLCKRFGLKASGKNTEMVTRLQEYAREQLPGEERAENRSRSVADVSDEEMADVTITQAQGPVDVSAAALVEFKSEPLSDEPEPQPLLPPPDSAEKKLRRSTAGEMTSAAPSAPAQATAAALGATLAVPQSSAAATPPARLIKPRPSRALRASLAASSSLSLPTPSHPSTQGAKRLLMSPMPAFPVPAASPLGSPMPGSPAVLPTAAASGALTGTMGPGTATNEQFASAALRVLAEMNARIAASGAAPATLTVPSFGVAPAPAGKRRSSTSTSGRSSALGKRKSQAPLARAGWTKSPAQAAKGKRFDGAHTKEFGKMDSIVNHYAAKRVASGSSAKSATGAAPAATGASQKVQIAAPPAAARKSVIKRPPPGLSSAAARRKSVVSAGRVSTSGAAGPSSGTAAAQATSKAGTQRKLWHGLAASAKGSIGTKLESALDKARGLVGAASTASSKAAASALPRKQPAADLSASTSSSKISSLKRTASVAFSSLSKKADVKGGAGMKSSVTAPSLSTASAAGAARPIKRMSTAALARAAAGSGQQPNSAAASAPPAPPKKPKFDLQASLARKPVGYTPYSTKEALAGLKAAAAGNTAPKASMKASPTKARASVARATTPWRAGTGPRASTVVRAGAGAGAGKRASLAGAAAAGRPAVRRQSKALPPLPKPAARPHIDREKLLAKRRAAVAAAGGASASAGGKSAPRPSTAAAATAARVTARKTLAPAGIAANRRAPSPLLGGTASRAARISNAAGHGAASAAGRRARASMPAAPGKADPIARAKAARAAAGRPSVAAAKAKARASAAGVAPAAARRVASPRASTRGSLRAEAA